MKTAQDKSNIKMDWGLPFFHEINSNRFYSGILAGVLGGAGVSAAANLLRQYRELREKRKQETNDDTIVLTLPKSAAATGKGYESMKGAKPGESHPTANTASQLRDGGRFGKGIRKDVSDAPAAKMAQEALAGDAGPNSVGTVVARSLGMVAGGLLSYEVVSRLFDAMHERRLKRKLEAAQTAYVNALNGASKRAEIVSGVLSLAEKAYGGKAEKTAADQGPVGKAFSWISDHVYGSDAVRYPAAAYILALLAGTGASAYVTKKVMDREFPEEKLKTDVNRPTRIVFKTAESGELEIAEFDGETEKEASGETCAAITAMLPIYMDLVEGRPSRTLAEPYVKIAEAMGTDSEGLLKAAADSMWPVYLTLLKNPRALWSILKGTNFGLNMTRQGVANILEKQHPDVYRSMIGAMRQHAPDAYRNAVAARLASREGDSFATRAGKWALRHSPDFVQDLAVDYKTGIRTLPTLSGMPAGIGTPGMMPQLTRTQPQAATPAPATASVAQTAVEQNKQAPVPVPKAAEDSAITCKHVLENGAKPTTVSGKGGLQAICGKAHAVSDGRVVSRAELMRIIARHKAKKVAEDDSILGSSYLASVIRPDRDEADEKPEIDPKDILAKAKAGLRNRHRLTVSAADPNAQAYLSKNKAKIRAVLAKLNAQGTI